MDVPPMPGVTETPEMWEKAEADTERLHEELKKAVQVEAKEIGLLRKELKITVPAKVIADHMEHNFSELVHDAFVPGFRKGRAPRRLIEKRYGHEVRESLTTAVVGQSFYAATENEKLDVLGDPLFRIESDGGIKLVDFSEALQTLKLPETGDFAYTCEVELRPTFELPELKGIAIKSPEVEITEAMVDEQMLRRRRLRGRLEPVTDAAQKDDQIIADVVLTVDGQEAKREENVTLAVRPSQVDGVPLLNLGEVLAGAKPGDSRTAEGQVPEDYERADLRGKTGRFEFKIHEIKRLIPEPMESFLKSWGFDHEKDARDEIRVQLGDERDSLIERAKRAQIEQYLLQHTQLELPQAFSTRQTEKAVLRRMIELQQSGVPMSDIEARVDELRTSAKSQVAEELKLAFVLDKVAETLKIEVTDEEVNTAIAQIARRYNRRFDRVRDDLQSRGTLSSLVEQLRHGKCIDLLLSDAQVEKTSADAAKAT